MSFLSRLRLKKNDKDPATSQSGVVELVQNEETSAKTDVKVRVFLSHFDCLDDYLQRFSQSRRDDLGLFRFGNTWQENNHVIELSSA